MSAECRIQTSPGDRTSHRSIGPARPPREPEAVQLMRAVDIWRGGGGDYVHQLGMDVCHSGTTSIWPNSAGPVIVRGWRITITGG